MKPLDDAILDRFFGALVNEINRSAPHYLRSEFTVAEIYQTLVPYRTHRDRIGVEMNGDYEDALLRLLAGEGDFLFLGSEPAVDQIRRELRTSNPNTGLYREFAALGVRLNPERVPEGHGDSAIDLPFLDVEPSEPEMNMAGDSAGEEDEGGADDMEGAAIEMEESRVVDEAPVPGRGAWPVPTPEVAEGGRLEAGDDGPREPTAVAEACPACEGALPERAGLRFCPFCGTNVRFRPCGACGEELEWDWRFCVACGEAAE